MVHKYIACITYEHGQNNQVGTVSIFSLENTQQRFIPNLLLRHCWIVSHIIRRSTKAPPAPRAIWVTVIVAVVSFASVAFVKAATTADEFDMLSAVLANVLRVSRLPWHGKKVEFIKKKLFLPSTITQKNTPQVYHNTNTTFMKHFQLSKHSQLTSNRSYNASSHTIRNPVIFVTLAIFVLQRQNCRSERANLVTFDWGWR